MRRLAPLLAALGMVASIASPQQSNSNQQSSNQQGNQQGNQQQSQPAPLFGGQIGTTKSSTNTKESATLGFNGVDPSGKVEKKMLGANPSAKDVEAVNNMDAAHPSRTEQAAFVKQGGLKSK